MADPKSFEPANGVKSIAAVAVPEPSLTKLEQEHVQRLPVIEESLHVAKKVVDKGGIRLTKRVETHDQLIDELLHSDHVEVERRLINAAISEDAIPGVRQEGDTLIFPVIEEVLVTVKRLVLVEEVRITRTKQSRRQAQTITLRKEHIDVERLSAEKPSPAESFKPPPIRKGEA